MPGHCAAAEPRCGRLERALDAVCRLILPFSIGVTLLLCAQWPLRDLVGAGAVPANDAAQLLFAVYVAVAIRHAGVRGAHLTGRPDLAQGGARWRRVGAALCVLPWSATVLWLSLPASAQSLRSLESFPESYGPGYFVIRLSATLLAAMLLLQSLLDLRRAFVRPAVAAAAVTVMDAR